MASKASVGPTNGLLSLTKVEVSYFILPKYLINTNTNTVTVSGDESRYRHDHLVLVLVFIRSFTFTNTSTQYPQWFSPRGEKK